MSAGFTPGPWAIGDMYADDDGQPELVISAQIDGKNCYPAAVCLQFPKMQGMQMANANLIAAAPELLASLIEMTRPWDHIKDANLVDGSSIRVARAAIAKATGSTP